MAFNASKLLNSFLSQRAGLTKLAYQKDLEDFRLHAKAPTVEVAIERLLGRTHPVGQAMLARYSASMVHQRGLGPATVNRRLSTLRSLGKEARVLGMVPWVLEARNVRHEAVRDSRGPGADNMSKLLTFLESQPPTHPVLRDTAIIRLITDLALRRGTICKLNVSDFSPERREIKVVSKGKKSREAKQLTKAAAWAIRRWVSVREVHANCQALFVNFDSVHHTKRGQRLTGSALYAIVKQRGAQAGVQGPIRPHGLRHTSITMAAEAGAKRGLGLDKIRQFSGHADARTLERYLDKTIDVQGTLAESVSSMLAKQRGGGARPSKPAPGKAKTKSAPARR